MRATSTHWDRRKLRVVCVIFASLGLAAVVPAAAAARAPKLTLHTDDGLDWAFGQNAAENTPAPGDTIKTTLRIGDGGQGQRGYAHRLLSPKPFVGGQKSEINFPIDTDDDDETRAVKLPFRFFFAGIPYKKVSVSTNGWIEFGGPALDYFDDIQLTDFRGEKAVMGRFFRGAMPYFADLDLTNGTPNGANFAVQPGTVAKAVSREQNRVPMGWRLLLQRSGPGANLRGRAVQGRADPLRLPGDERPGRAEPGVRGPERRQRARKPQRVQEQGR